MASFVNHSTAGGPGNGRNQGSSSGRRRGQMPRQYQNRPDFHSGMLSPVTVGHHGPSGQSAAFVQVRTPSTA